MKIFLTGGTGFIGSYVLRDALYAGHEVIALRRSVQSRPHLTLDKEPFWLERDLIGLTPADLDGCSVVVHLASAGVSPQQAPWEEMVRVNVVGSAHLIATANQASVTRMVVSGTCHEYGIAANLNQQLDGVTPLVPVSLYGASKASGYQLLSTYAQINSIELFYGRIFNVYGDGQFEQNFWPSLKAAASQGNDFPMTSGEQIRDFIAVEEVASRLLGACTEPYRDGLLVRVENICSSKPQTLLDFAEQEWKRLGAKGKLMPGVLPQRSQEASQRPLHASYASSTESTTKP
jgi:nucleoside-diphosphate-sugar epimerase